MPAKPRCMTSRTRLFKPLLICAGLVFIVGCTRDELFGPGGGVDVDVNTPSGVQTGKVQLVLTLKDDDDAVADIGVRYSVNGGASFLPATAATGSVAMRGLAVSPTGTTHVFIWDSAADLGDVRLETVQLRVSVDGGKSDQSGDFSVHNQRYLLATHDTEVGEVSLLELDVVAGGLRSVQNLLSGGRRPWDVIWIDGRFYVVHRDTNDVSVLELDENLGRVAAVAGSPFAGGGLGAKYLATDGETLYVSNIVSQTLSIFEIDETTGGLALHEDSGIAAAHCRSLVVRGSRLYVANETDGEVLIFEIAGDGGLTLSALSPIRGGGLTSPVGMIHIGGRLFVSNFTASTLASFRIQGDGDLVATAGSPFSFTGTAALELAVDGELDTLWVATSGSPTFAELDLDSLGIATETADSPQSLRAAGHAVVAVEDVVVIANGSEELESFVHDETGGLTSPTSGRLSLGDAVGRMAVSD